MDMQVRWEEAFEEGFKEGFEEKKEIRKAKTIAAIKQILSEGLITEEVAEILIENIQANYI